MEDDLAHVLRKLVRALKFYGPFDDFDLAEYLERVTEDAGAKARDALRTYKRYARQERLEDPEPEETEETEEKEE